jgi:hypothetical protein
MTLLTSQQFFLRFVKTAITGENALYGSETFGADPFSYGQEATETVFPSTDYTLLPHPGHYPQSPGWSYRVGDQNLFSCSVVDSKNPSDPIDVSAVSEAYVVLAEQKFDHVLPWYQEFELTIDEGNKRFTRNWLIGDLGKQGRFRVNVRILFNSGRHLTVESKDETMLFVNSWVDAAMVNEKIRSS